MKEMVSLEGFISGRAESIKRGCLRLLNEDLTPDTRVMFLKAIISDMDKIVKTVSGASIQVEI